MEGTRECGSVGASADSELTCAALRGFGVGTARMSLGSDVVGSVLVIGEVVLVIAERWWGA